MDKKTIFLYNNKKCRGGAAELARCEIAGLQVDVLVTEGRTWKQLQPYLAEEIGPADITVQCDAQRTLDHNPQLMDLDSAEYLGTGAAFARALLKFNGFQLHSSAVMLDGKAYLFSAPSGTGKSTHTEKWCRLFGAKLLNDDKPALRLQDGKWMAYGTPWSGKHDLSTPTGVPLGGVAFLQRAEENRIRKLDPQEAVPMIISQSLRFLNPEQMDLQLTLLDKLLRQIPVWLLECRNDDEAAYLSHRHMGGGL